jgi:hypothetical protein
LQQTGTAASTAPPATVWNREWNCDRFR